MKNLVAAFLVLANISLPCLEKIAVSQLAWNSQLGIRFGGFLGLELG